MNTRDEFLAPPLSFMDEESDNTSGVSGATPAVLVIEQTKEGIGDVIIGDDFVLEPASLDILNMNSEHVGVKLVSRPRELTRITPPNLPTIEPNLLPDGSIPGIRLSSISPIPEVDQIMEVKSPETETILAHPEKTDITIRTIIQGISEADDVYPYFRKIQKLDERISGVDTTDEMSQISVVLYYMIEQLGVCFHYEENWAKFKKEYIARAKKARGNFYRLVQFLTDDKTEELAHDMFLESFKSNYLKDLFNNMTPVDIQCVMYFFGKDDDKDMIMPQFKLKYLEKLYLLFDLYFQKYQELEKIKEQEILQELQENQGKKQTPVFLSEDEILARITHAREETDKYFYKHFGLTLDTA